MFYRTFSILPKSTDNFIEMGSKLNMLDVLDLSSGTHSVLLIFL